MSTLITLLSIRFWKKVHKTSSCWLWTGSVDKGGYGRIWSIQSNTRLRTHRYSWELHNGPIPEGAQVLHNCPDGDNPACVNPNHLFLGSNNDNVADMMKKGRHGSGAIPLTKEQVAAVRQLRSTGMTSKQISERLSIREWHARKYMADVPRYGADFLQRGIALRKARMTMREVAEELDISKETLTKLFREAGIAREYISAKRCSTSTSASCSAPPKPA